MNNWVHAVSQGQSWGGRSSGGGNGNGTGRPPDRSLSRAEIAARLGHFDVLVEDTDDGGQWFASCVCGWVSPSLGLHALAVEAAVTHLHLAIAHWQRNGGSLPGQRPNRVRPEQAMRDLHGHYAAERSTSDRSADGSSGGSSEAAAGAPHRPGF